VVVVAVIPVVRVTNELSSLVPRMRLAALLERGQPLPAARPHPVVLKVTIPIVTLTRISKRT